MLRWHFACSLVHILLNVDCQTIVDHLHLCFLGCSPSILRASLLLRLHLLGVVVDADGLTGIRSVLILLVLRTELFGCSVRIISASNSLLSHLLSLSEVLGQFRLVALDACLVEA